ARAYPHFTAGDIATGVARTKHSARPSGELPIDWQREADRLVLGQYAPPGVLVNDNLNIVQFRGETGAYLKPAAGEASFDVLKMAREGLFLDLRSAIAECREHNAEARREGVRVHDDSVVRRVNLRVIPVTARAGNEHCFLILFEEASSPERGRSAASGAGAPGRRFAPWFSRW